MKRFENTLSNIKGIFSLAKDAFSAQRAEAKAGWEALPEDKKSKAKAAGISFAASLVFFAALAFAGACCGLAFEALAVEGVAAVTTLGLYRMKGCPAGRAWMVGLFPAFMFIAVLALMSLLPFGALRGAVEGLSAAEGGA